jgi:uncharacterized membrane protein
MIIVILGATLLGSFINIPLVKLKSSVQVVREEFVDSFGVTYRIPRVQQGCAVTTLAVNVGGALIPTAVSIYLLSKAPFTIMLYSLVGVAVVAFVTRLVGTTSKGSWHSYASVHSADSCSRNNYRSLPGFSDC